MLIPFLPLVGIVLGIFVLRRPGIRSGAERGRMLALWAIIIPPLTALMLTVLIIAL